MTAFFVFFFPILIFLGSWQVVRGLDKESIVSQHRLNKYMPLINEDQIKEFSQEELVYRTVSLEGAFGEQTYILDNRLGSSSMYEPDEKKFDLYDIKNKDLNNFKITQTIEIECDTMSNQLSELNVKSLDYLKIDTQGAELEILKGMGNYRPLLIKIEAHFFSMYKNVPDWNKLVNYLSELNYVLIDWKGIGGHNTRIPVEADMIFIPNFNALSGFLANKGSST